MSSTYPAVTEGGLSRRPIAAMILIAASTLLLLVSHGSVPASGSTYVSDQAVTYQDFGGAIRNSGSGWHVINDSAHEPDSITIGAVTTTSVQVHYPACDEVVSVVVGPDETYAATYGATFGASVGLTYSYIKGSINDGSDAGTAADVWDPTTDYSGSSNIWISGRCEVSP